MAVIQVSDFTCKVIENIRAIPKGRVATYKQIAELSGKPQGSRGVAWILHSCSTTYKLPWHRVLGSSGKISFPRRSTNFLEQRKRLEREGVHFSHTGVVDLEKFRWKKKPRRARPKASQPLMFRD